MKRKSNGHSVQPLKPRLYLLAALLSCATIIHPLFAQPRPHLVTNLADAGPGSLRDEIATAHPGDTISFAVHGTIALTNGELLIANNLKIAGPGAKKLAISALSQSRVVGILPHAAVSFSGLTICDGHASDGTVGTSNSPAGGNGSDGGGIYNAGSLTMSQCVISNCVAGKGGSGYLDRYFSNPPEATNWIGGAGGRGGGIYNAGKLALIGSIVTSNSSGNGGDAGGAGTFAAAGSSGGGGGAIYNTGTMTLTDCAFEYNTAGNGSAACFLGYAAFDVGQPGGAGGSGGAVYDAGQTPTFVLNCQFSLNASGAGSYGTTTGYLIRPAIGASGGAGGGGGAIWGEAPLRMTGCTFLSNQTGSGAAGSWGGTAGGAGGTGGPGGAIYAIGDLSLSQCLCASNYTGGGGNGGSTPSGFAGSGASGGPGGAIYAIGELSLSQCLCASNYTGGGGNGGPAYSGLAGSGATGGPGGAIYSENTLRLDDCTFTGNWAGSGGRGASVSTPRSYPTGPGSGGAGGCGGALFCQSDLAATDCTFNGNQAGNAAGPGYAGFNPNFSGQASTSGSGGGQGGAIFGAGPLVLQACTLSGNLGGNGSGADSSGAALAAAAKDSADPSAPNPHPDFIYYDRAGGPGGAGGTGGIYSENSLTLSLCTLNGNLGGSGGGGGASWGSFMLQDGPWGGPGGPGGPATICCSPGSQLALIACTIAVNRGGPGGPGGSGERRHNGQSGDGPGGLGGVAGIFMQDYLPPSPDVSVRLINTLVASNLGGPGGGGGHPGNTGVPDLQGSFISLGHNLIGSTDGSSGFTNGVNNDLAGSGSAPIDPLLGPLADNGGPTPTMALLHGSPALDAGDDSLLRPPYSLKTDQRGFPRKSGSHVDIGAFEFQFPGRGPHAPTLLGGFSANANVPSNTASKASDALASPNFQLTFSDTTPGVTFTVLATTNLSLPFDKWTALGQPLPIAPGIFQFTDLQTANNPQRFYRVTSP